MTEAEWRSGTDFAAHVRFVHDRLSPRRRRLLAVGFCRAAGIPSDSPDLAAALDVIDRYADGDAPSEEVARVRRLCLQVALGSFEQLPLADVWRQSGGRGLDAAAALARRTDFARVVLLAATTPLSVADVGTRALYVTDFGLDLRERLARGGRSHRNNLPFHVMRAVVWEVAGNPFRVTHFAPAWRTDTAVALARQMYASRDFGAMPILADALQDAGCDDEGILTHCRDEREHVRGCWVVDLLRETPK